MIFTASLLSQSIAPAWRRSPDEGEAHLRAHRRACRRTALAEMRALLRGSCARWPTEHPTTGDDARCCRRASGSSDDGLESLLQSGHAQRLSGDSLTISVERRGRPALGARARGGAVSHLPGGAAQRTQARDRPPRARALRVRAPGEARLVVTDDGAGFAPAAGREGGATGFGLRNMRERAAALGGTLRPALRAESWDNRGSRTTDRGRMTMGPTVRVLLVDDHQIVREGLRTLFNDEPGIHVVGEAASAAEAVDAAARLKPDVVILDLIMPGGGSIDAHPHRARAPSVRCRCWCCRASPAITRCTTRSRPAPIGYMLKDVSRADLVRRDPQLYQGQPALHPEAQRHLVRGVSAVGERSRAGRADGAERGVLGLIARGRSNKSIAAELEPLRRHGRRATSASSWASSASKTARRPRCMRSSTASCEASEL